jgi:hypothetical protein
MLGADYNALQIESGMELERFDLGTVIIKGIEFVVLTGYEGSGGCMWCGTPLKGKHKYCYGHMTLYYNNFNWGYASFEAKKRAGHKCENCGVSEHNISHYGQFNMTNLEVHHIVPLKGEPRFFSAFNLPWNLIYLCHTCHLEVHKAMRPPPKSPPTTYEQMIARGQYVLI